jgi:hypothetical protein
MRCTVYKHSRNPPRFFQAATIPQAAMHGFEKDFPFCSNPDCILYVRAGDPGVIGSGNWAELPDGRIVGRILCGGIYLCDLCGHEWHAVPTFGKRRAM